VSGTLVTDAGALLGVSCLADTKTTRWFDAKMGAMQAAVDALLPDTVNQIDVSARAAAPIVLATSFSDTKPPSYRLFDHRGGSLNPAGQAHPAIDPARMGRQQVAPYKARGGLDIPALLTLPAGDKRKDLPLVVLVHRGPYVRGSSRGWKSDTQFLASRGYAVLEPAYRGSTGFGERHYRAGWKQWGLKMQDDIADGAKWAIAQGLVDPKRICIAGASYGGYATLMGLINDPALFKCGVAWVGVTDIGLLFDGHWSFKSDQRDIWRDYGMPLLVGDPVADAAQFKATSPLARAARLKQPVLLAYGAADQRVPLYHGTQFRDAVRATNAQVEWPRYDEEGHGWALPKNRIDFWGRVEQFLERHIGKP
jgi:dipeptidyl aminopeptidase/acylaminoacyl peptidase